MKKIEVIELLQKRLPRTFDKKLLAAAINVSYVGLLQMLQADDLIPYCRLIGENGGIVLHKGGNGFWSGVVPSPIVSIQLPGSGVRQVMLRDSFDHLFVPVSYVSISTFRNLNVTKISGVPIPYAVYDRNKIVFVGDMDGKSIMMNALVPFTAYDNDEDVYMSDTFVTRILEASAGYLVGAPLEDKVIDQSDKTK